MSTPQDPMVRKKQKARRTKQLAAWRAKKAAAAPVEAAPAKKAEKAAPAKKAAKAAPAKKAAKS